MPSGLVEVGNIDLAKRPIVRNRDGSISTIRSMSVNIDGREVLLPTVSDDGRIMSDDEAIAQYERTGRHLGIFDTPEHATAYAEQLHQSQADTYLPKAQAMTQPQSILPQQQQQPGLDPRMIGLLGIGGGLLANRDQPLGQSMMGMLPGLLSQLSTADAAKIKMLQSRQQMPAAGGGMLSAQGWQPMVTPGPQGIY